MSTIDSTSATEVAHSSAMSMLSMLILRSAGIGEVNLNVLQLIIKLISYLIDFVVCLRLMEKKIIYLLLHIGKLITDEVRSSLSQYGLHFGQARILLTLLGFEELNQKEISEGLHIKPATVTNLIKKLESSGLVNRVRSDKDDRVMNVSLTTKGIEAARIVKREMDKLDSRITNELAKDELKTIITPLLRIRDVFGGIEPKLLKE